MANTKIKLIKKGMLYTPRVGIARIVPIPDPPRKNTGKIYLYTKVKDVDSLFFIII